MNRNIVSLIVLSVLLLTQSSTIAKTTTVKKYDSHHNYSGKYVTEGNKTKIYSTKNNNYDGYYKEEGSTVKHYSSNGNFIGKYKKEN